MSKEKPNYNDLGEIFCIDCPHFVPLTTSCEWRKTHLCPTEPTPEAA